MSRAKSLVLASGTVALLVLMFAPIRIAVDRRFWERLFDAGHLPLFCSFAALLWWSDPLRIGLTRRRMVFSVVLTIAIAGAVELVQPGFGRTKSFDDFRNGALGALIAGVAIFLCENKKDWRWWAILGGATAVVCGVLLEPAWVEGRGMVWRRENFPMLGDFEEPAEMTLWEAQGGSDNSNTRLAFSREHASHGLQCLRVKTGEGSWAGVTYFAGNQDWSGRSGLSLDVFNPRETFTLSVRVDDDGDCSKFGQRYDDGFSVSNGWNHLKIPVATIENGPRGRRLNIRRVRRLAIFTGESQPSREFFLDHIGLE